MPRIDLQDFRGGVPRRAEELLDPRYAEQATNCKLTSGEIRPYGGLTFVETPAKPGTLQTIYYWANQYWFHWNEVVDIVKGPIRGDTTERVYFTGVGVPQMTYSPIAVQGGTQYPTNSFDLGVPAPESPPTLVLDTPSGSISNVTNANPITVSSVGHGLATGTYVNITGVMGTTELNGRTFVITRTSADAFTLTDIVTGIPVDGTQMGTYTGGGTWTVDGAATPEEDRLSRSYVYTYVSALGEEGAPSDPSLIVEVAPGESVNVNNLLTGPVTGNYQITAKRVYRRISGPDGASFQFVGEVAIGTSTFLDDVPDAELGETLEGLLNDPPPDDMHSLIRLPNGILAGASKNELCLSVPGQPHAWPVTYRQPTHHDIVAIGNFGTSIVVATEADAYLGQGTDPQSISLVKLEIDQGCVSKRGMVSLGLYGVAYPSPDGLVLVSGESADIVTEPYLHRDDWLALNPSSIHAYLHDRYYVGFYDAGGGDKGGFIFDPRADSIGIIYIDIYATAGYADPLTDDLYLVVNGDIDKWDANDNAPLSFTWKSKIFDTQDELNFAIAEIVARSYGDLTFRLYADLGDENLALVHTETVSGRTPFRLSEFDLSQSFQVEVSGTSTIRRITLATDIDEL